MRNNGNVFELSVRGLFMANITEINIMHVKFVYNFTMLTMDDKVLLHASV